MQLFQEQGFFPTGKTQTQTAYFHTYTYCIPTWTVSIFTWFYRTFSSGHCSLPDEVLGHISHQGVSAAEDQGGQAKDHADGNSF